jgi:exosortase K
VGAAAAVVLVALGAAFALKRFYSTASAADLRFVLTPTTWLVEVAGGHRFDWTSGGYLSTELRFLIAPACAGVNFLIVAFAALVLGFVRPARPAWQNVGILLASAAAAFATTVLVNALRILIVIPLWIHRVSFGCLTGARLHELVGVMVFLGMLLLLHLAARRLARAPVQVWVPLLAYAGVVLVVPLLRGAHQRPGFWVHAVIVAAALLVAAVASVDLAAPRQGGPRRSFLTIDTPTAAKPSLSYRRRARALPAVTPTATATAGADQRSPRSIASKSAAPWPRPRTSRAT